MYHKRQKAHKKKVYTSAIDMFKVEFHERISATASQLECSFTTPIQML